MLHEGLFHILLLKIGISRDGLQGFKVGVHLLHREINLEKGMVKKIHRDPGPDRDNPGYKNANPGCI